MGCIFNFFSTLIRLLIYCGIFVAAILLLPYCPPHAEFSSFTLEPTLPQEGVLALNGALNNAQHLLKDKIHGPEAFELFDGDLYTGLDTGEVVKITPGGHVTFVTKIGQPCHSDSPRQEEKCGRPLGLQISKKDKSLYVCDAYYGIWKVNMKTHQKKVLIPNTIEIEKKTPKIFNSIALDQKNDDLYWTESSSQYSLHDGLYTALVDPNGRLLHYNAAKNLSVVLLDKLAFANGVALSPDNEFVIVCETSAMRIKKYYIHGPRKGQVELFISGLPGTPDNIQTLPDGSGILVALYVASDNSNPLILKSLSSTPLARKFLARVLTLIENTFIFAESKYSHEIFRTIIHKIGHFSSIAGALPQVKALLHLDWNGNILGSYYNTDSSIGTISDAIVFNDKLFTGSPHNDYIGVVNAPEAIKRAYSIAKKSVPPVETDKKKSDTKPINEPPNKVLPKQEKQVKPPTQTPEVKTDGSPEKVKAALPKQTEKPVGKKEAHSTEKAKEVKTNSKPTPSKNAKPLEPKQENVKSDKEAPKKASSDTAKVKPKVEQNTQKHKENPKNVGGDKTIPIKEDIVSDTVKPNKDTLKVIKKEGPTEIPNPNKI